MLHYNCYFSITIRFKGKMVVFVEIGEEQNVILESQQVGRKPPLRKSPGVLLYIK